MARRPTVLVVEDSDVMFGQYRAWLAADYALVRALTAAEALQKLYDLRPSAVLLDWVLAPDARKIPRARRPANGRDVLRGLRASALRDTWVVMVTAKAGLFTRFQSRAADVYLSKPVTEAALRSALRGMRREADLPAAPPAVPSPLAASGQPQKAPLGPAPAPAALQGGS